MIDSNREGPLEIDAGADTDGDGRPDTLALPDGPDLSLVVDTDQDGLADLLVRIEPDATVTGVALDPFDVDAGIHPVVDSPGDPMSGPIGDACYGGFPTSPIG